MDEAPSPRRRIKELEVMVAEAVYETPDTTTLMLFTGTDHLVHLCAGSGSVPNFAILKHALRFHPKIRHTFIYSNKTWDDVIFRRELTALEEQHPDRLRVVHTLTRESRPGVRTGRVSTELIRELVPDIPGALFFTCGPAISAWDKL